MSLETFLAGEQESLSSSNVGGHYDRASGELQVEYQNGDRWSYEVSETAAVAFYQASSYGTWLWDNVKIRGTRRDHRVPAREGW